MKITSVEVRPENSSEAIVMSFRDPQRLNPYNIKAIDGLDADEIISRFYRGSGNPNKKFYNLSIEKRSVSFRVQFNPNFEINQNYSDLRDDLYRIIASSRTGLITLHFKNGTSIVAVLSGFVTKMESPQFTKEPEAQFTIRCIDPLLKSPDPFYIDPAGLDEENFIITDSYSTAPHGFKMEVVFRSSLDRFSITDDSDPSWEFSVEPESPFEVDDVLYFSSELNNKYLFITRGEDIIFLGDRVVYDSVWPLIFPKDNHFNLYEGGYIDMQSLSYYLTYWGV